MVVIGIKAPQTYLAFQPARARYRQTWHSLENIEDGRRVEFIDFLAINEGDGLGRIGQALCCPRASDFDSLRPVTACDSLGLRVWGQNEQKEQSCCSPTKSNTHVLA